MYISPDTSKISWCSTKHVKYHRQVLRLAVNSRKQDIREQQLGTQIDREHLSQAARTALTNILNNAEENTASIEWLQVDGLCVRKC